MKQLVKNLAIVATLSTTAVLLVADSARPCPHELQEVDFNVTGDCGNPGTVRLTSPASSCGIDVENAAAVNLPNSGGYESENFDITQGGWMLSDTRMLSVPDGEGNPTQVEGRRVCLSRLVEGVLMLHCEDLRDDRSPSQVVSTCSAVLTRP
jgi:hypothetical protein